MSGSSGTADGSTAVDTDTDEVADVDGFLKYLAVNGIIQNGDSYGRMPHNY